MPVSLLPPDAASRFHFAAFTFIFSLFSHFRFRQRPPASLSLSASSARADTPARQPAITVAAEAAID
jgi:hypothetical protein